MGPHQALQVEPPDRRHLLENAQIQQEQGGGGRDPGVQRSQSPSGTRRRPPRRPRPTRRRWRSSPRNSVKDYLFLKSPYCASPSQLHAATSPILFSPRLDVVYYVV